jgi:hypothetical protein
VFSSSNEEIRYSILALSFFVNLTFDFLFYCQSNVSKPIHNARDHEPQLDRTRILLEQNVHARRHEAMLMCVEGLRVHGTLKHLQLLILKSCPRLTFCHQDTNVNVFVKDYVGCLLHPIC